MLPNGDFELGPKPSDMKGTQVINKNAIPSWELTGFVEYIQSGQKQGDMLLVVPAGKFAVRLGNEASIKQRLNVTKGMYYSLTFSAARTCAQDERLNISVAPDSGVIPIQTVYSSSGWDLYAWAFQAESNVAEIVIHNPGEEEDPACGPLIDGVAIKALYPPRPTNSKCIIYLYVICILSLSITILRNISFFYQTRNISFSLIIHCDLSCLQLHVLFS